MKKNLRHRYLWVIASLAASASPAFAQSTAFTYQGQLKNGGSPASGDFTMTFSLFDAFSNGTQQGPTLTFDGAGGNPPQISVTNGLFTVSLDFGVAPYTANANLWVEINVNGTTLSPRQPLSPAPFALNTRGLAVDSSGNVGISTAAPSQTLDVAGIVRSSSGGFMFPDGTTQVTAAAGGAGYWTANGINIYNNNAGNVGVGVANPAFKIDTNSSTGTGARLGMQAYGGGALVVASNQNDNRVYLEGYNSTNNGNASEMLITGYAGGLLPQLTLSATNTVAQGRVGIGTATPGYPLTIRTSGASASYGWVHTDGTRELGSYVSSSGGWLGTRSNHPLYLFTNDSSPRVTLATDGTLGVGTTSPSAWGQLAVFGNSSNRAGYFEGPRGGVTGWSDSDGFTGITGGNSVSGGVGLYSAGNFVATGTKSFQIDHPFDPENKYLNHYCAEGPEPLNVYRGNVTLDAAGEAWVTLPNYFGEINRDPAYQLTAIGQPAPVYVKQTVVNNRFQISGGKAGMQVSWRVEAIRNDRLVRAVGAPVEINKPADKRGSYLQPELYGQPAEKSQFYRAKPSVAEPTREMAGVNN